MNGKILVAYASYAGSTKEVAEAIGETLAGDSAPVDVLRMRDVKDLSPYRAVVAGSAIQGQKWLPEGMQFVQTHRAELNQKPLAAFLVCITLGMKNAANYRQGVSEWMQPVRALARPVSEGLFAGKMDLNKLPWNLETAKVRLAVKMGALPDGDHRDWQAIRAWAESLLPLLARQ